MFNKYHKCFIMKQSNSQVQLKQQKMPITFEQIMNIIQENKKVQ